MKKIIPLILAGLILAGCSGGLPNFANLIASPTVPTPSDTPTPQPTVTLIPTLDYFATSTATPITFTPTSTSLIPDLPTDTPEPLPVFSPQIINNIDSLTYFNQNKGFLGVLFSSSILYWNEGPCMPRSFKMSVFVEDLIRTENVYMFLRLRDKKNTLHLGEWSAGAQMLKAENGSFNYEIRPRNLRKYYYFKDAWLEYQFVAVTEDLKIIGRSQIYDRNISLVKCKPVQ
jgi:hypothetical protein